MDQNTPISLKIQRLFQLRTLGTPQAIDQIIQAYNDQSILLQHQVCYVLGQIQSEKPLSFLIQIMQDQSQPDICRHEAAEAIGAIGNQSFLGILQQFQTHPLQVLSQTCELAVQRINWIRENIEKKHQTIQSVDPAPGFQQGKFNFQELVAIYNDTNQSLFRRYRALFSLRNIGNEQAVIQIARGLNNDGFSSLFQHEISFVMGQMQEGAEAGLPYLVAALEEEKNHYIVRHEAAEAIGAITNKKEYLQVLLKHINDPAEPIRSSCQIALDISNYWFDQIKIDQKELFKVSFN